VADSKDYFQGGFKPYQQVNSAQLGQIFAKITHPGLNLLDGLQTALDDYFTHKAANHLI
jgi:hypothetical protein